MTRWIEEALAHPFAVALVHHLGPLTTLAHMAVWA